MNCQGNPELISAFIDGELSDEEAASAAAHIDSCPACSKLRDEYQMISQMFADDAAEVPEGFTQAVMQRITAQRTARKKDHWKRYGALAAVCAIVIIAGVSAGVLRGGSGKSTGSTGATMKAADMAPSSPSLAAPQDAGAQDDFVYMEDTQEDSATQDTAGGTAGAGADGNANGGTVTEGAAQEEPQGLTDEPDRLGGTLHGMAGSTSEGKAITAAETGAFGLNASVTSLEQAVALAQELGIDYSLFVTKAGQDALVISLDDFRAFYETDGNLLYSEAGNEPESPWVLITQTE